MRASHHFAAVIAVTAFLVQSVAGGEETNMRTLAKGAFSGITNKQQLVIKDVLTWETFWARHTVSLKPAEKIPKLDFDKEMVIALTLGEQRTGGYRIEIINVKPEGDKLKVIYKRFAPPPDGINLQVITAPFHFVAIPKNDLKPEFVETEK